MYRYRADSYDAQVNYRTSRCGSSPADYIKDMAENYFGIGRAALIKAEMLDIEGNDPERILAECAEHYYLD